MPVGGGADCERAVSVLEDQQVRMYVVSGVHLGRGNEHRMSHR